MFKKTTVLAASLMLLTGLFAAGCGNNACEDAVDHAKECGAKVVENSSAEECSEKDECVAACANDASCDTLTGKDQAGVQALTACAAKCGS